MPSKQVTDRQKSANAVVAAIDTHSAGAATAIATSLSPHLRAGEVMPDVGLLLTLLGRNVTSNAHALVTADDAHLAELADDDPARSARGEAAALLRQECVDLREILIGMYGAAFVSRILPEAVPRDPVMLTRHSQTIEDNLARITLPEARIAGANLDKTATMNRLAKYRRTLEEAIALVAREVREAQATQSAKDAALDSFDHCFSTSADVTGALLCLAGMPEQAARLRPSARRPGQTVAEEETAEMPAPPPANG